MKKFSGESTDMKKVLQILLTMTVDLVAIKNHDIKISLVNTLMPISSLQHAHSTLDSDVACMTEQMTCTGMHRRISSTNSSPTNSDVPGSADLYRYIYQRIKTKTRLGKKHGVKVIVSNIIPEDNSLIPLFMYST